MLGIAQSYFEQDELQWETVLVSYQAPKEDASKSPYGELIVQQDENNFTADDFDKLKVELKCTSVQVNRNWLDISLFTHPEVEVQGYAIGQISKDLLPAEANIYATS